MKQYADVNLLLSIAVAILSLFIVSPYVLNSEATRAASVGEREAKVAERESFVAARESALYWKSIPPPEIQDDASASACECSEESLLLRELDLTRKESSLNKREANVGKREAWLIENWPRSD